MKGTEAFLGRIIQGDVSSRKQCFLKILERRNVKTWSIRPDSCCNLCLDNIHSCLPLELRVVM